MFSLPLSFVGPASALVLAFQSPLRAAEPGPPPGPDCVTLAREAAKAHPAADVFAARAKAMVARGRADSAMPAAMADFEVWNFPLSAPQDAGQTMFMLGVEQRWPLGKVRRAMLEASRREGEAMALEGRAAVSAMATRMAHACIDWSAAERRAASLEGLRANAAMLVDALRTVQVAGASAIAATMRAKAELAATERMVAMAHATARGARDMLQALVDSDAVLPAAAPALGAPERPLGAPDAGMDGDETHDSVMLAVRAAEVRAANAEVRARTVEAKTPELTVGGSIAFMHDAPLGLMAKIGIELPWLTSGPEARVDEARANAAAARAQLDTEARAARAMIADARARIGEAKAAADVLVAEEIPALERAATLERAGLGTGDFDLAAWIETSRALRASVVDLADLAATRAHAEIDLLATQGRLVEVAP